MDPHLRPPRDPSPRCWVLNLDADDELGAVGGFQPSKRLRRAVAAWAAALAPRLLGPRDVWMLPGEPPPDAARGRPGVAWCPTPRALAALEKAGALPPPAPSLTVLRAVNHRRFAHRLEGLLLAGMPGGDLPGGGLAGTAAEARGMVQAPPPAETGSDVWLLKRAFGHAGRGHRRVAAGAPDDSDLAWIDASFPPPPAPAAGAAPEAAPAPGLVVEPLVRRRLDLSIQGVVLPPGTVHLGPPGRQVVTAEGVWRSTHPLDRAALEDGPTGGARKRPGAPPDRPEVAAALARTGRAVGEALARAGYHGPFGVDAFVWEDATGRWRLRRCSDVNARYTTAWGDLGPRW